jgi:hypothetical protein
LKNLRQEHRRLLSMDAASNPPHWYCAMKTKMSSSKSKAPNRNQTDRKPVSAKDWKILIAESGGYCAFPDCPEYLVADATEDDEEVFLGDIAHIVGASRQGPRGDSGLKDDERSKHQNLLLLCKKHHTIIDSQKNQYSIPVLIQMKMDQKNRAKRTPKEQAEISLSQDKIFSTLMSVTHIPQTVFVAPCNFTYAEHDELKALIKWPRNKMELAPYVLHSGHLYAFHDLRVEKNPFADCVNRQKVTLMSAHELWALPEGKKLLVRLLNSAMFKYCSRLNVRYDPMHSRFYFPVDEEGKDRSVTYKPLNLRQSTLKVAWNPITKATGEGKKYWLHRAAKLKFHNVGDKDWVLSIRPERHVTSDGITPLLPEKVGPVVTRQKARMYNEGYLTEVNFWRGFLSNSRPRLILEFGMQSLVISSTLQTFDVVWPGIENDDKPYKNQELEEDMFSLAEFERAIAGLPPTNSEFEDDFEEDDEEV